MTRNLSNSCAAVLPCGAPTASVARLPTLACSPYRYTLDRDLYPNVRIDIPEHRRKRVCWMMLNPSTADETVDDPTIRRVKRFSLDAGYTDLVVVNCFALRATRPPNLLKHPDPVGPDNVKHLCEQVRAADALVCAWGSSMTGGLRDLQDLWYARSCAFIANYATHLGKPLLCLGTTASGQPRHPLYVKANQPLVAFEMPT